MGEQLLTEHSAYRVHPNAVPPPKPTLVSGAEKTAEVLKVGANIVAAGIVTGAGMVEKGLKGGSNYVREKNYITTDEKEMEVSDETLAKLEQAKISAAGGAGTAKA